MKREEIFDAEGDCHSDKADFVINRLLESCGDLYDHLVPGLTYEEIFCVLVGLRQQQMREDQR